MTVWGGPPACWVMRCRTAGAPQKAMVPGFSAVAERERVTVLPANSASSTRRGSHRYAVVTVWSTTATSFPSRWTLAWKVTGPSSGVPRVRSSTGCEGSVSSKRAVSGDRVTRVSRKTSRSPCQLTPEGTSARCSRRKTSRTDSIAKSAPGASVGRIRRWRMRAPVTGVGGVTV